MAYQDIINYFLQIDPVYQRMAETLGLSLPVFFALLMIVSIWAIVWKGIALWKSARSSHKVWFIVLVLVNTLGILEILYIYVFSKMADKKRRNFRVKK